MKKSGPKLNAEGWEIVPATPHKIKTPVMIEIPAGKFLMGTSDENIKQLQLKESDWAYEWFDNDLFAAEQPQHTVTLPAYEIAHSPITNAEYYTFIWDSGHRIPRAWTGYSFQEWKAIPLLAYRKQMRILISNGSMRSLKWSFAYRQRRNGNMPHAGKMAAFSPGEILSIHGVVTQRKASKRGLHRSAPILRAAIVYTG